MERVTTIRRRPKSSISKTITPTEKQKSYIDHEKNEPIKSFKDNGQATIQVKLDYLPEIKYADGKKQVLLPIRTPQLGLLQFFMKSKTYRKYRQMILDMDEDQGYHVVITAPHVRLEKRSGTPTCYSCEIQIKKQKKKKTIQ